MHFIYRHSANFVMLSDITYHLKSIKVPKKTREQPKNVSSQRKSNEYISKNFLCLPLPSFLWHTSNLYSTYSIISTLFHFLLSSIILSTVQILLFLEPLSILSIVLHQIPVLYREGFTRHHATTSPSDKWFPKQYFWAQVHGHLSHWSRLQDD